MPDIHSHDHDHDHGSGSILMYLRHFRDFWHSPVNRHVVDLAGLRPSERVLDIGAGMGPAVVIAASLLAKGEVIAVDPSPFMQRVLKVRRILQRGRRLIQVLNGTAEHLPIADESVDAAWAVNSMHHWNDFVAAAAEIRRVLAPGGRLVLLDEDFDHPDHRRHDARHRRHNHPPMVDLETLAQTFTNAGYTDVSTERYHIAETPVLLLRATKPN